MARRKKGLPINGWLVLDKPQGRTSTQALARVRALFNAQKAGHAGTLDPLATGVLPIAFGEATKTVSYAVDGAKSYRFTVKWGEETATDDSEGEIIRSSPSRPAREEIAAKLDDFIGEISQIPPRFSAIKVDGNRAYDLARQGEVIELEARKVKIDDIHIVEHAGPDNTTFNVDCAKGTYIRAIARDLGRVLGCLGHVCELRRTRVGDFREKDVHTMHELENLAGSGATRELLSCLRPLHEVLNDLPCLAVSPGDAADLSRGKPILMRGRDAPIINGPIYATCGGVLIAIGEARKGSLHPTRVFNLG